jgi:cell division protein FtsI/penicillin-binding protein 2
VAAKAHIRAAPDRAKFAFVFLACVGFFLAYRLIDVQVRQGPHLAQLALDQRAESVDVLAKRGSILDRDGNVLVRSLPSESVYAVPTNVSDPHGVALKLAPILGMKADDIEATLRERAQFRWLARKIPHSEVEKIRALGIRGIALISEDTGTRFTTSGKLASTVLGFVGIDENGLDGLEYAFDSELRGTPGKMQIEADQFGRAIPFGETIVSEQARPGHVLRLTLDSYLQYEAENDVALALKKYRARSGVAIIMDPNTGEILALASMPDFEPTRFASYPADARRDRAVMDAYEPGSVFKLVTAAAGLESGRMAADARFPARDSLAVGGRVIHNAEDGFPAGHAGANESVEDIIAYSHNVGAAEMGMRIGAQPVYRMIRAFGFGDSTQIELPGENPGIIPPVSEWSDSSLPTISFGQGVSTTPIALVRAYAAIANGGWLLRPHIVAALESSDGTTIRTVGRTVERRVISEKTAATLRRYLRAAVARGTGKGTAEVAGYTTAGKTGTAQVVENGRYEPGAHIPSFIGYIPAERPRFVIFVKIDQPSGAIYYGSEVAAPIFADLARKAMLHGGMMPSAPTRLVRPLRAAKEQR